MVIVEESHALSSMQAGNRKNMSCMVQINLLLHVIKHAHRNDKPLYIISTDVRKAFDTVAYEAFTKSLTLLGFRPNVVNLFSSLQSQFNCRVRTPAGMSDQFEVGRGCKQGCSLSPLRFILVYDIFLKYLEFKKAGYKWELKGERFNGERTLP